MNINLPAILGSTRVPGLLIHIPILIISLIQCGFLWATFRFTRFSARSSFPKPTPLGKSQISQRPKWIMKNATGWEGDVLILVAHPTNRKWVITPSINGISRVNSLITGVITCYNPLTIRGMSHQVLILVNQKSDVCSGFSNLHQLTMKPDQHEMNSATGPGNIWLVHHNWSVLSPSASKR